MPPYRTSARVLTILLFVCSLLVAASPVAAAAVLIPPVDGPAIVRFVEPPHRWAPGHRGIDYALPAGTAVRAAGGGTVAYAGKVAGHLAVTIDHGLGMETTYTALSEVTVERGQEVGQGTWIGYSGRAHPGGQLGLHFGVKVDGEYVDPASLLGSIDVSRALQLAPLVWQAPREMPEAFRSAFFDAGTAEQPCRPATDLDAVPSVAPNDNIAVAIAGIGSSTDQGVSADMYEHGPEELGYERVYPFSYAGPDDDDLHRPYSSIDTYADISESADELRRTLEDVAQRHPGSDVDLIAHSMGGLVARRFLAEHAGAPGLPRVEHLVTFATPHQGASIARIPDALEGKTLTGGLLLDGASAWAGKGGPIPDPRSVAVEQLAPGSEFLSGLGRESVAFGTRVLALGIANDVVVTADRARWDQARSRIVEPSGLMGHSSIVASDQAQGLAYAFLRDAPPTCETRWDLWGPRIGRATGFVEENSYRAVAAAEAATLGRVLRVGQTVDRYTSGRLGWVARKVAGKVVHRAALRVASRFR